MLNDIWTFLGSYGFWVMFFALMVGHALADYALQTDFIAKGKNRHTPIPGVPWYYIMGAHCLIHGGFVAALTGSLALGLFETGIHIAIDISKCDKWIDIHMDQFLHTFCKIAWALMWMKG